MRAHELMTHPALSISADLPTERALVFAKSHGIHHLPLQVDDEVVGLVCTCDLREVDLKAPVSRALKRDPVIVSRSDTSKHIAEVMRRECISSVLVAGTEGFGIVTKDDLLREPSLDEATLEIIDACRCMYCRTHQHLRRHGSFFACVSCLERAEHPERFEGGIVD